MRLIMSPRSQERSSTGTSARRDLDFSGLVEILKRTHLLLKFATHPSVENQRC